METELPSLSISPDRSEGTASGKKIEANRRNARLATGPKTAEGKKTSSRNAIKHGLLVKNLVITGGGREDQAEFDSLLAEMLDYYEPVGIAEDLLVQEIATSYWRSARALRCQRGAIADSQITEENPELTGMEEPSYQSSTEARTLLDDSIRKVEDIFKKRLSEAQLEKSLAESEMRERQIEEVEADHKSAKLDSLAIPLKDSVDRIHRYETGNLRHRYKVEARLERLQAQRIKNASKPGAASHTGSLQNG